MVCTVCSAGDGYSTTDPLSVPQKSPQLMRALVVHPVLVQTTLLHTLYLGYHQLSTSGGGQRLILFKNKN